MTAAGPIPVVETVAVGESAVTPGLVLVAADFESYEDLGRTAKLFGEGIAFAELDNSSTVAAAWEFGHVVAAAAPVRFVQKRWWMIADHYHYSSAAAFAGLHAAAVVADAVRSVVAVAASVARPAKPRADVTRLHLRAAFCRSCGTSLRCFECAGCFDSGRLVFEETLCAPARRL